MSQTKMLILLIIFLLINVDGVTSMREVKSWISFAVAFADQFLARFVAFLEENDLSDESYESFVTSLGASNKGSIVLAGHDTQMELLEGIFKDEYGLLYAIDCATSCGRFSQLPSNLSQIFLLPNHVPDQNFNLRLDSNVYTYLRGGKDEGTALTRIQELYAVNNGTRRRDSIGVWDEEKDIFLLQKPGEKWERRQDLGGAILTSSNMEDKPFFHEEDITGFSVDLVMDIASRANFTLDFSFSPADRKWGARAADGSYNGIIGVLERREVDISITALSMDVERQRVIDFTHPICRQETTLIVKQQNQTRVDLNVYFYALSIGSWFGVAVSVALISVVITLPKWFAGGFMCTHIMEALAKTLLHLGQRDGLFKETKISTRIVFFTSCLFGCLIFSCYSANLTSSMVNQEVPVVSSLRQVLDGGYRLAMYRDTYLYDAFRQAESGTLHNEVFQKLIKDDPGATYDSADEAHQMFRTNGPKFGAFDLELTFVAFEDLDPVKQFDDKWIVKCAWGLVKESEFTDFFNHHLLKLKQSGFFNRLELKWKLQHMSRTKTMMRREQGIPALGYDNSLFPFVALSMGAAASMIFVCCEICTLRIKKRRSAEK